MNKEKRYGCFKLFREMTTKEILIKILSFLPDDVKFISFDRDILLDCTIVTVSSTHFPPIKEGEIIPEIKFVQLENGDVKWRFGFVEKVLYALKGK